MKTRNIVLIVVGVLVAILAILCIDGCNNYNKIITTDEVVTKAWGDVESDLQRRSDLIPNLVATVKGSAKHEQETLQAVIDARSQATSIQLSAEDLSNPAVMQQFQAVQDQLSGALSRLMMTVERYPDLKANQSFQDLQVQLEGTENRINTSRKRYNEAVAKFNITIRRFPGNIVNSWFAHLDPKTAFEAAPEAKATPKVEF